ncbi:MAG: undecaprenyl/decaprenyl-phosphate alpha-N-acetylglucosaminyl 1-phosphate transferase, partial [Clostridia bacterium]|nr:undecaprenyl/decaprenyl-phosphate alpha-N-acetylglucosaminyl 1-phosphate transferase [Clostridia bacterium]
LWGVLLGALVLIILGIFDDKYALNPWIKLVIQFFAALIPTLFGVQFDRIMNIFGGTNVYIDFGWFAYPITVVWIMGLINAVNWIDGLDGLAAGISCISALSMFLVSLIIGDPLVAGVLLVLAGSCMGFLPYNMNPAKIFMGDTGSMFLGYMLAVMSILGMFKFYAIVSFAVPFLVVGLPLFDSVFTIIRRLFNGKSPFYADRGHIHHRLIDLGLNTKQAVMILYLVSGALGITAVVLTSSGELRAMLFVVILILAVIAAAVIRMLSARSHTEMSDGETKDKE